MKETNVQLVLSEKESEAKLCEMKKLQSNWSIKLDR